RLIDGGVWANNPSVVAIAEAVSMLDVPLASIRVLNVGTIDQLTNHPNRLDRGGLFNWAKPIAPLILNAGSRGGQRIAEHLRGKAERNPHPAREHPRRAGHRRPSQRPGCRLDARRKESRRSVLPRLRAPRRRRSTRGGAEPRTQPRLHLAVRNSSRSRMHTN